VGVLKNDTLQLFYFSIRSAILVRGVAVKHIATPRLFINEYVRGKN